MNERNRMKKKVLDRRDRCIFITGFGFSEFQLILGHQQILTIFFQLPTDFVLRKFAQTATPTVNISQDGDKWKIETVTTLKTSVIEFKVNSEENPSEIPL